MLSLLCHSISLLTEIFLVVDGLDQCSPEEQRNLLQSFFQLIQMPANHGIVKILISARESIEKEVERALETTQHLRIGLADTDAGLALFTDEILADKRRGEELVVGDETIMDEIADKLRAGGEGM